MGSVSIFAIVPLHYYMAGTSLLLECEIQKPRGFRTKRSTSQAANSSSALSPLRIATGFPLPAARYMLCAFREPPLSALAPQSSSTRLQCATRNRAQAL